jgi:hypothetical protein
MSVQAENSRSCSFLNSLGYKGSLVIWTVVCLTATKFKPLVLSVPGFALSNIGVENLFCRRSLQLRFDPRYIVSGRTAYKTASNSCLLLRQPVAAETCLQSHCLVVAGCLGCCNLAINVPPRSTILAFSHHVTIFYLQLQHSIQCTSTISEHYTVIINLALWLCWQHKPWPQFISPGTEHVDLVVMLQTSERC